MGRNDIFFWLLFLGCAAQGQTQTVPQGLQQKGLTGNPTAMAIPQLPNKPEIPHLEELRQLDDLRRSYDSLKNELKQMREMARDTTLRDSLLQAAKVRGEKVLDKEGTILESLADRQDIPSEEVKNASRYTLDGLNRSKDSLRSAESLDGVAGIMELNEENLKALTNEWVMPAIEKQLGDGLDPTVAFDPRSGPVTDFYGSGALAALGKDGFPAQASFGQAKALAQKKARHIPDEYLRNMGKDYNRLKIDPDGNILASKESVGGEKASATRHDQVKGVRWSERLGAFLWYDPLTAFGQGVYGDLGLSYRLSRQLTAVVGAVVKRQFDGREQPIRDGTGMKIGVRRPIGHWFLQGEAAMFWVKTAYPTGHKHLDYEGMAWNATLGVGRNIPLGKALQSVVIASWSPLHPENRSLSPDRFQLRIGFELPSLRISKSPDKSTGSRRLIHTDSLKNKVGNHRLAPLDRPR